MTYEKNFLERSAARIESVVAAVAGIFSFLNKGPLGWVLRKLGQFGRWYRSRIWNRYARNAEGRLTK